MLVRKAIIAAGGLGTRFLPATKAIPKEMFPIVDTPTLEILVKELSNAGIEQILIITGRGKDCIINHFDSNFELETILENEGKLKLKEKSEKSTCLAEIFFKRQVHPSGFADAILKGETFVNGEPFVLCVGDEIIYNDGDSATQQLIKYFNKYNKSIFAVKEVADKDVHKYGIIDKTDVEEKVYKVNKIVEKPKLEDAPSRLSSIGKYLLTSDIFNVIKNTEKTGKEVDFSKCLTTLAGEKGLYAADIKGVRYDTGSKLGYVIANLEFALRDDEINEELKEYLKNLKDKI